MVRLLLKEDQQVAGESGMIQRVAEALGPAAGAHVEAVHGKSGMKRPMRQAQHVPGFAASLQPVQQHQFTAWAHQWTLRLNEHLDIGRGPYQSRFDWERPPIVLTRPVVTKDGEDVRIRKERLEFGSQHATPNWFKSLSHASSSGSSARSRMDARIKDS